MARTAAELPRGQRITDYISLGVMERTFPLMRMKEVLGRTGADTTRNNEAFGCPGASRGKNAYPQIRFVSLVESGTRVLFGTRLGGYHTGEITLAKEVIGHLKPRMLCIADRNFFGFALWEQARATGAELLWRVKKNVLLQPHKRLKDGSFLSEVYPSIENR